MIGGTFKKKEMNIDVGYSANVYQDHEGLIQHDHHPTNSGSLSSASPVLSLSTITTLLYETYSHNSLFWNLVIAIICAYIYPALGGVYVYPEISSHWLAVILIFYISGLSLRIHDMAGAASNIRFHIFVQCYNLFFISFIQRVIGWILLLPHGHDVIDSSLVVGMIIGSCLPMPSNMAYILTVSSKGDEAMAILNSTLGNLLGVFISPILVLLYLGHSTIVLWILEIFISKYF